MPSAIVTGATGMLGREIVFQLSRSPQQWPTVHALSRSKKEEYPENVIHHHVDLQSAASDMASSLQNVRGEYIFFAAYLQKDNEQENWDVNGAMLSNFLSALVTTGAIEDVKRIVLITGAKQYGVHLGAVKNPMLESDPWLTGSEWPPNFYYNQQNILHEFCASHNKEWTVTYPNDVIGYAYGNFMNFALAIAIYAVVTKELGQDLVFPGAPAFYTKFDSFTSSKLHAEFCAWAALEPRAANEAFNVVNGDTESWQNLWPKVALRFGLKIRPDQIAASLSSPSTSDEKGEDAERSAGAWTQVIKDHLPVSLTSHANHSQTAITSTPLHTQPPISASAASLGLSGHPVTEQSRVSQQVDLVQWAQREDVQSAWKTVAQREKVREDGLEKATWGFTQFVLGREYNLVIGMSKARRAGWMGYKDTWESLDEAFGELQQNGVVPGK